ncbi:hypothetical protein SLS60_006011 [Paraconiothyrium brasiliense]|uniref:Alpha/beta hydrolase fold-3 domain-containing protein n=1 Tax=Paraconiothyrium brasiliense TaxID=300254 RepID=A0ABR3RDT3_9PLEO
MSLENDSTIAAEQAKSNEANKAPLPPVAPALDPGYAQWVSSIFPADATPPPLGTIVEMRESTETMIRTLFAQFPPQPTVTQTSYTITSSDGAPIDVIRFTSPQTQDSDQGSQNRPAVLHFHGGGHCGNSVSMFERAISELVVLTGVQIFSVEYRLAPEHPAPAALEDGYAALTWLSSNAASLGVDASRIAIMGESSGGGLAAGIALLARDRGFSPGLKKMVLVYPMLDDRSITQNPAWDADNRTVQFLTLCWEAYVGKEKAGDAAADVSCYAAPGRAESLKGLPGAYMEVGELDEFKDECQRFAERLAGGGTNVEFHLWPGVPHGFDAAREIGVTKRAIEGRVRVLREL